MRAVCTGTQTLPPRHYRTHFLYTATSWHHWFISGPKWADLSSKLSYTDLFDTHTGTQPPVSSYLHCWSAGSTGSGVLNNLQGEKYTVCCVKSVDVCCVDCCVPPPRTVTLVTIKPVFGPAAACAQPARVNSGELLIVRSVLITVMAILPIKPPAVLWGIVHHNDPHVLPKLIE